MGHSKTIVSDVKQSSAKIHISERNGSTDDRAAIRDGWLCADCYFLFIRQATDQGTVACLYQHDWWPRLHVNEAIIHFTMQKADLDSTLGYYLALLTNRMCATAQHFSSLAELMRASA